MDSETIGCNVTSDKDGNVYVMGSTGLSTGSYGHILAQTRFYLLESIDQPYGQIGEGTRHSSLLWKFNRKGEIEFVATLPFLCEMIVTDSLGSSYMIGGSWLYKYHASGKLEWSVQTPMVHLTSIALHPDGGVALIGKISSIYYNPVSTSLLRYTSDGNRLWEQTLDFGSSHRYASPTNYTLKCDGIGNIYFVYRSNALGSFSIDRYLAKFDKHGNYISKLFIGQSYPIALEIDKSGNILILKAFWEGFELIKQSQSGDTLWRKQINKEEGCTHISNMALDQEDNPYLLISGKQVTVDSLQAPNNNYYNSALIKISSTGEIKWLKSLNRIDGFCSISHVTVNALGPICAGFAYKGTYQFNADTVVVHNYSDMILWQINEAPALPEVEIHAESAPAIQIPIDTEVMPIVDQFHVYPNPARNKIVFLYQKNTEDKNMNLNIFGVSGQRVYAEIVSDFSGTYSKTLDLNKYAKGIYLIEIRCGDAVETKKIVLE